MRYRVTLTIEKDDRIIHRIAVVAPPGAPMSMTLLDTVKLWAAEQCFPDRLDDSDYLKTGQVRADL